jgi:hypothetical protein
VLLDLSLAAAAALLFLSAIKTYDTARRHLYAQRGEPVASTYALHVKVPSGAGEKVERAFIDEAATAGGLVSGATMACPAGPIPQFWVLWGLRTEALAERSIQRLAVTLPGIAPVTFRVDTGTRSLFASLVDNLPPTSPCQTSKGDA